MRQNIYSQIKDEKIFTSLVISDMSLDEKWNLRFPIQKNDFLTWNHVAENVAFYI